MLVGIVAIFVVPILVAMVMTRTGRIPVATKQHGELLDPRPDLSTFSPELADGSRYPWNSRERTWRIAVAPPPSCTSQCAQLARELHLVWQLLGKDADKVHVLWMGVPPAQARQIATLKVLSPDPMLRAKLPRADDSRGVPVYVIDTYGFVYMRYPPGFDPGGLRADLAKLLKLK